MNKLISLFYPPKCLACGKVLGRARDLMCPECAVSFVPLSGKLCRMCGLPLYEGSPSDICGRCRSTKYYFSQNVACFLHKDSARQAVLTLKYRRPGAMRPLADMLTKRIVEEGFEKIDCITYVPATKKREQKRGYNQAALLARRVAKNLGVPFKTLLVKIRETSDQKTLSRAERFKNVRGAYVCRGDVYGKTVLIIDDAFTTGATLSECAKMLCAKKAFRVYTATVTIRALS